MSRVMAVLVLTLAVMSSSLRADDKKLASSSGKEAQRPFKPGVGQLLLVRAWNPTTGELVGWMPAHNLAVALEQLNGKALKLEHNQVITMYLPRRPQSPLRDDGLSLSPDAVTFRGRKWLPLEQDPEINIVRIDHVPFYLKAIVFDDFK
jgi:hypothetical protein